MRETPALLGEIDVQALVRDLADELAELGNALSLVNVAPSWAFNAKFSWSGIPPCGSVSPAFELSGVPAGTAKLRFQMRDLDKPDFPHGGSTVDYKGGTVARAICASRTRPKSSP